MEALAMMDSPVCLIENTKARKLTVNEEAIKILITIEQPVVVVVVVVSIDVLYQIEKSYLMNKLAAAKKELDELAKMYTSAIMVSNMACMEEIAHSLSDMENKIAVQEAAQHYENMMKERVVFPTDTLDQFLQISSQCEDEAHQIFLKRSFRDKKQKFMKNLMSDYRYLLYPLLQPF
ncbi:guanylate-binding protein 7-like [Eleutherodactylus coqui]|uniref:guanylate-binding protein 7-like n=1 Tax=Eleutherodactylus coqui TaxID=57060 RepID=UPI003462C31B